MANDLAPRRCADRRDARRVLGVEGSVSAEKAEALVWPMVDMLAPLSPDHRIALLMALISQEICMFPAHERGPLLAGVINDLPGAFRATEDEMRKMLTDNAMRGM